MALGTLVTRPAVRCAGLRPARASRRGAAAPTLVAPLRAASTAAEGGRVLLFATPPGTIHHLFCAATSPANFPKEEVGGGLGGGMATHAKAEPAVTCIRHMQAICPPVLPSSVCAAQLGSSS